MENEELEQAQESGGSSLNDGLDDQVKFLRVPRNKTVWKHKKGKIYLVVMVTNLGSDIGRKDFPPTIVYRSIDDCHDVWSRPLAEWFERFEYYGDMGISVANAELSRAADAQNETADGGASA